MKQIIRAGQLPSIIHLPPSKSYANRALILAALKPGQVTLKTMPKATDVTFLIEALKQVGLDLVLKDQDVIIKNSFPACERSSGCEIRVGEGGTTARFLASLLVLGSKRYILILGSRLKDRPWSEFVTLVNKLGGKAELNDEKLSLQGPIRFPQKLEVDCTLTTQFASGLQLASAFMKVEVIPTNMEASGSYWEMTRWMIKHFQFHAEFSIPLDWSSASYPLAFGALRHNISFPGLKFDPYQADAKFYDILKTFGALVDAPEGLKVKPISAKHNFNLDVSDCLDLVPTLGFFLSHVEGTHRLRGVDNLVHKESDRLSEVIKLMDEFGLKASVNGSELTIEGSHSIKSPSVDLVLPEDHRMVMAGVLFLRFHQGGSVAPAEAVEKSYPDFFSLIK